MKITLGHSPDPDDAFMFYALQKYAFDFKPYDFEHIIQDIEKLNQRAFNEEIDLTALSIHAYAHLSDRYQILNCGASVGDGYGPIVVSREFNEPNLRGRRIAIPGKLTTAFLALKLFEPEFEYVEVPFDQILECVVNGQADFGLVIHEGQITYQNYNLNKVVDLGDWWKKKENLPLPLGVNAIRKSFPNEVKKDIQKILFESIEYGLENRQDALEYALGFGRGIENPLADQFVSMYVNDYTLDLGNEGREAIQRILQKAYENKIIEQMVDIQFVEPLEKEESFSL